MISQKVAEIYLNSSAALGLAVPFDDCMHKWRFDCSHKRCLCVYMQGWIYPCVSAWIYPFRIHLIRVCSWGWRRTFVACSSDTLAQVTTKYYLTHIEGFLPMKSKSNQVDTEFCYAFDETFQPSEA